MQIIKNLCFTSTLFVLFVGWSSEQSVGSSKRKQKTNVWGTLIKYTGQKKEYLVDNISIERLTDQIRVFELPAKSAPTLTNDPRKGTIIYLDLKEIAKIETPEPKTKWLFKRDNNSQELEFIELIISPRGGGKANRYIIERSRRLYCDEKSTGGPIEMDVPLNEIKELIIEGFSARTEEQQLNNDQKRPIDCCPCPVNRT